MQGQAHAGGPKGELLPKNIYPTSHVLLTIRTLSSLFEATQPILEANKFERVPFGGTGA